MVVAYLVGSLPQGRLGVGSRILAAVGDALGAASAPSLRLSEVDAAFSAVQVAGGSGSAARRRSLLGELFSRATEGERRFLDALVLGELRQGALDGVMLEALSRAADVEVAALRRAWMLGGDLPEVAEAAFTGGLPALDAFALRVFSPVLPMLAQPADDLECLFVPGAPQRLEAKLDGARVQAHKKGDEVRLFSRSNRDLSAALPDVVRLVAAIEANSIVLDGETLTLDAAGRPRPFQESMRRVGRTSGVAEAALEQPATARFFDLLYLDGESLIDRPLAERARLLAERLPHSLAVDAATTDNFEEARAFFSAALAAGHEGIMIKSLDSAYEVGNRGGAWRKWKPVHTIELVVLAAEWGSGRRRGWLSNLHLGARDGEDFAMVGKTFKGLTDEILRWQTGELLARETCREGAVVRVRPELVVEIAFDGVLASRRYGGGVALRFARVRRYRDDVAAADVEALESLRARLR